MGTGASVSAETELSTFKEMRAKFEASFNYIWYTSKYDTRYVLIPQQRTYELAPYVLYRSVRKCKERFIFISNTNRSLHFRKDWYQGYTRGTLVYC